MGHSLSHGLSVHDREIYAPGLLVPRHSTLVRNNQPNTANVDGKLTTLFELVHHVAPYTRTWLPLFSIAYFYKDLDNDKDCTTFQSKDMIGIAIGQSTKTNVLSIYNPITKK